MLSPGHVKGQGSKTRLLPVGGTRGNVGTPGLDFGPYPSGRGHLGHGRVLWLSPKAGGLPETHQGLGTPDDPRCTMAPTPCPLRALPPPTPAVGSPGAAPSRGEVGCGGRGGGEGAGSQINGSQS